jgi:hypothetical protein
MVISLEERRRVEAKNERMRVVLQAIADFRTEHHDEPSLLRVSPADWDTMVRGTYHYPPRDDDYPDHPLENEKIWHDPEDGRPREGRICGVRAYADDTVKDGDVQIS